MYMEPVMVCSLETLSIGNMKIDWKHTKSIRNKISTLETLNLD